MLLYGLVATAADLDLSPGDAAVTITGHDNQKTVGTAIAGPGDADGDGSADLLIGAEGQGWYKGRVFVHHGPITGSLSGKPNDTGVGHADGMLWVSRRPVGRDVSWGDADGDGLDDVFLGGDKWGNTQSVYIQVAPHSGWVRGYRYSFWGELRGAKATFAGDVDGDGDGDGDDDFIIGTYNQWNGNSGAGVT